ncbi:MAG TPA: fatty acid desaturase [Polyangiaceae bacterium]
MRLRFAEDKRTLFWAFVLFPLGPVLACARPELTLWLAPLSLYVSYCSGVLTHNHNHCPTFLGRGTNAAYGAWLSLFYGFPIFSWVPTHNQNHHRYLDGPGDDTRTSRHTNSNTLLAALTYPIASARWQMPSVIRYARASLAGHPARRRRVVLECAALAFGHLAVLGIAVALHGSALGAFVYLGTLGVPAALATYFMMFTNFVQHIDCDPASPDDHSRNFTSPFWNWFVFENGLHTVHHEHPGVHWSRLRALHAARAHRIDPRLNVGSIFEYLLRQYLLRDRRLEARRLASAA